MIRRPGQLDLRQPAVEAYLLGQLDFDACLALQQRLVYEAGGRADGQITLLVCEHAPAITVGRQGSRGDIRRDVRALANEQLTVRWINRGGGALMHAPGQLAIYPIVPLEWHGFSVGGYLARLQQGLQDTLAELNYSCQPRPSRFGLWGRTGQVAAVGVAVKHWVTYFGAYLNIAPPGRLLRMVTSDPRDGAAMSSLEIERQQPQKMSRVREGLVRHLAAAFGCQRYHLYTGHPLLGPLARAPHDAPARVG